MDLGLAGDTAITVASSSGLGYASAAALAREGTNVVVNGRDREALDDAVESLRSIADGEVVGYRGDIGDGEVIAGLVEATVEEFGGIDHLVTSAGGPPHGAFLDHPDEHWYEAFDMLVMSLVRLTHEATPYLRDGGGSIVFITSITVKEAFDSLVLSNAVRMSAIGLGKTLSRELAPAVRVNALLPGFFETDRMREGIERSVERGEHDSYDAALSRRAADVPLGRVGDPSELGAVAAFLCSDRASYLNGEAILLDGGLSRSNL